MSDDDDVSVQDAEGAVGRDQSENARPDAPNPVSEGEAVDGDAAGSSRDDRGLNHGTSGRPS